MKIAVFGGTGRTGAHVVQQALDAGHEVVALARTPSKVSIQHDKLTIVQGDIQDAAAVEKTVQGVDAVVSVLGPVSNTPDYIISQGTNHIINAMKKQNVKRLVISAGAGVRDPKDTPGLLDKFVALLLNLVSKHVVEDMRRVVQQVRNSDRDWTVVRVPMLTDQPPTGDLIVSYVGQGMKPRLSRADMASFMLKQLQDDTYVRQAPAISN